MSELRLLPIMRIYNTDFYLDRDKREFRQVDNEQNTISFADVKEQGDHDLIYDLRTKNTFKGKLEEMINRNDLVLVKLPEVVRADIDRLMSRSNKLFFDGFKNSDKPTNMTHRRKKSRGI